MENNAKEEDTGLSRIEEEKFDELKQILNADKRIQSGRESMKSARSSRKSSKRNSRKSSRKSSRRNSEEKDWNKVRAGRISQFRKSVGSLANLNVRSRSSDTLM